ncbi:MAG: phage tail protein [Kofleriaceae bacterium]
MANERSYVGGRFSLNIDGWEVGYLKSFSGLEMQSEVAVHDTATDIHQKKQVTNIKWTPGKATVGIGMGKAMSDWIAASMKKTHHPKSGSLTAADFDYKAKSTLTFQDALITEVKFPALDGGSKEPAYIEVSFEPEQVRWARGGGEDIRGKIGEKQKGWASSQFRVEIDGLKCDRIAKVSAFSWKCSVVSDMLGIFRENTKHPAKISVDDLTFEISYADHQAWAEEAKKWFIDGDHEERHERNGRIVYLAPNMKDELGEVRLYNIGFKTFAAAELKANAEEVKRFKVTMYVERYEFENKYSDA